MGEKPASLPPRHVYLRFVSNFPNDERLLSALKRLRDTDTPDRISENIVNLKSENREEWTVVLADDEDHFVSFRPGEDDGSLVIDCFFPRDAEEDFMKLVESGTSACDDVWVQVVSITTQFEDLDFLELNLPFTASDDFDIRGIRLGEDSRDFIVQTVDEATVITYTQVSEEGERNFDRDLLDAHYDRIDRFVEELRS